VVLEVEPVEVLSLQFEYPQLDAVMRFIAQNQLELRSQRMALDCALDLAVPPADLDRVLEGLRSLGPMTIKRQGPRG
jgi:hypothetical protein